jgi:hypothetical protein
MMMLGETSCFITGARALHGMDEGIEMNYADNGGSIGGGINSHSTTEHGNQGASGTSITAEAVALLPTAEQFEIAESILARLNPNSKKDIGSMIHRRGQIAGLVLASLVLFWWLSVLNLGSGHEYNNYTSQINSLSFTTVAWLLPILVFFGSLLNAAGRNLGKPAPSLFAGVFFLICIFLAAEPVARALFGDGDIGVSGSQSVRLLILGCGTFYSAKLFIESYLLDWVKKLEESIHGIEISEIQDNSEEMVAQSSGNDETQVYE